MGTTHPKVQGFSGGAQSMTIDIDALKALFVTSSDTGSTITEMAGETGVSPNKIQKLIKQGVLNGIVKVGKRWVENDWDGKNRSYTVYSMKENVDV